MDDASLREVLRYLKEHFPRLSIESSHALTATEHWFKLRGEVNGDLFIRDGFFRDYPAERVFQRLHILQAAEAVRASAGRRRVVVTPSGVRYEAYPVRRRRRKPAT